MALRSFGAYASAAKMKPGDTVSFESRTRRNDFKYKYEGKIVQVGIGAAKDALKVELTDFRPCGDDIGFHAGEWAPEPRIGATRILNVDEISLWKPGLQKGL